MQTETRSGRALFEKLKEFYGMPRYSKHQQIRDSKLAWLGKRVAALSAIVRLSYTEHIAALERSAEA
jgi:hypothetical protein